MPSVGHHTSIPIDWLYWIIDYRNGAELVQIDYNLYHKSQLTFPGYIIPPIVPMSETDLILNFRFRIGRGKHTEVPQLDALILGVGNNVAPIITRIDVGDPIEVSN